MNIEDAMSANIARNFQLVTLMILILVPMLWIMASRNGDELTQNWWMLLGIPLFLFLHAWIKPMIMRMS